MNRSDPIPPLSDEGLAMRIANRWAEKQPREVLEVFAWMCLHSIPPHRQDDLIAAFSRHRCKETVQK